MPAHNTLPYRALIFGNSGAGKSTRARELSAQRSLPHLDLDTLAWEPTDPPTRTPLDEASNAIRAFVDASSSWIVEGCYADLLAVALPQATHLIFLDLPVEVCQAHARHRPWEPHKYPSKEAQDANLSMLLAWIATYPTREGVLGRSAHVALFESFDGEKERILR